MWCNILIINNKIRRFTYSCIVLGFLFCSLGVVFAKSEGVLPGLQNPGFVEPPAWFKSSFLDLAEDIAEAASENKRLLFFFYQDGCPYCEKLINVNFTQKFIVDKARQNFDVVAVNMWGDREVTDYDGKRMTEKEFSSRLRVMFTPTLIFFNEKGETALRLNGYFPPAKFSVALDYVITHQENNIPFRDFLKNNSPILSRGVMHNVDYFRSGSVDLSKRKDNAQYQMILFEQKQCPACDELHRDTLKRPETEILARRFDVVQLDMWSKKSITGFDGKKTTALALAQSLNVKYTPSFVFFDKENKEVIRIEAYLKAFHIQSVMDYVFSGAYKKEPSFQRYIDVRAEALREKGVKVELMN